MSLRRFSRTLWSLRACRPAVPHGLPAGGHEDGENLAQAPYFQRAALHGGHGGEDRLVGTQGFLGDHYLPVTPLGRAGAVEGDPDRLTGVAEAHGVGIAVEGERSWRGEEVVGLLLEGEPQRFLHAVVADPGELLDPLLSEGPEVWEAEGDAEVEVLPVGIQVAAPGRIVPRLTRRCGRGQDLPRPPLPEEPLLFLFGRFTEKLGEGRELSVLLTSLKTRQDLCDKLLVFTHALGERAALRLDRRTEGRPEQLL